MKKGIVFLLIIHLTVFSSNGQPFLGSYVTYQIESGDMTIFQTASFSLGYEDICPELDFFEILRSDDSIVVELYYDITGAWPAVGCSQYDQILISEYDTTICHLVVNTNIITYDVYGMGTDTIFQADINTFNLCASSIDNYVQIDQFTVYPNPTHNKITVDYVGYIKVEEVYITDLKGVKIKEFNPGQREFDLSGIKSGCYIIQIRTRKFVVNKTIIVN